MATGRSRTTHSRPGQQQLALVACRCARRSCGLPGASSSKCEACHVLMSNVWQITCHVSASKVRPKGIDDDTGSGRAAAAAGAGRVGARPGPAGQPPLAAAGWAVAGRSGNGHGRRPGGTAGAISGHRYMVMVLLKLSAHLLKMSIAHGPRPLPMGQRQRGSHSGRPKLAKCWPKGIQ